MNRTRKQAASKLLRSVWSIHSLERAWRVIQENARSSLSSDVRKEVEEFSENSTKNLKSISSRLSAKSFQFKPAKGIPIPKKDAKGHVLQGKFRPIVLANVEARIVQRSILDTLLGVPNLQKFTQTNYSFGGIKKRSTEDISAVPAAIQAALHAIGDGANFVMCADIEKFFTKIPKASVSTIVADAVRDNEFMELFERAITIELSNLAELREKATAFPIFDIGVAQGNSLSPLLGNILLHDFDEQMNAGDCRCIRYIDDFILLAPSKKAAATRMNRARELLAQFGMTLNVEKTTIEPLAVTQPFEFLGIELNNGFLRPSERARNKFLGSAQEILIESRRAFREARAGKQIEKRQSLVATLKRLDGLMLGWGKHYKFCNDRELLHKLDARVTSLLKAYFGEYSSFLSQVEVTQKRHALGIELLGAIELKSLEWPKRATKQRATTSSIQLLNNRKDDFHLKLDTQHPPG